MRTHAFRQPKGFIALITVIIIGAMVLTIGASAAFIGQTSVIMAGNADYEQAARSLANACVEEALHRLKLSSSYAGGTVPLGSDSCTSTVTGSGSSRTIVAAATVVGTDSYTKTVTVGAILLQNTATTASGWTVSSWTEGDPP